VPDADAKPPETPARSKRFWGAVLTATPIVLTVLSTAFAGLSSSEMTRSMYYRSLAAQHQAKAGDQWAFFQAKRTRGTTLEATADLLDTLAHPEPFNPERTEALATGDSARERFAALKSDAIAWSALQKLGDPLPHVPRSDLPDAHVQAAIDAAVNDVRQHRAEAETAASIAALKPEEIEAAIRNAEHDADAFDQATRPTVAAIRRYRELINLLNGHNGVDKLVASFRAAALDYDARRLRREADFNQRTAELFEVRVRRSGLESDRHRHRSELFFYSMLVAQFGVTVASLALARQRRSLLWLLAAVAGTASLAFTGYIYVTR
jgi:hypothetical protein